MTEGFGQIGQGFSGTRVVDVSGETPFARASRTSFLEAASAPTLQDAMQRVIAIGTQTEKEIKLLTPFVSMNKTDILREGLRAARSAVRGYVVLL